MTQYKLFMHSNGVSHRYKLKSTHYNKKTAERAKKQFKLKHYYVRIQTIEKNHKTYYKVYAFALWD